MPEPKILLFDIETSLSEGRFYDLYKEGNIVEITKPWFMLSFAFQWLGEKKIHVKALPHFPGYEKNKSCDKALVTELHRLLCEADVVVAHNAKRFDVRMSNARFIANGLPPPSTYKVVDTLLVARKYFKFLSNRLSDLGKALGVGGKIDSGGIATTTGCMAGEPAAWLKMIRYNRHDVRLLHAVYLILRRWMTTHPNLDHYTRAGGCPVCQATEVRPDGWAYLTSGKRQRMLCRCGHRFSTGPILKAA